MASREEVVCGEAGEARDNQQSRKEGLKESFRGSTVLGGSVCRLGEWDWVLQWGQGRSLELRESRN